MKTIRISDEAYDFLKYMAQVNKRSLKSTLDFFVDIYKESQDEKLEKESLSSSKKGKNKTIQ